MMERNMSSLAGRCGFDVSEVTVFKPYRTAVGSMDHGSIMAWCQTVAEANKSSGFTNPFSLYERLLDLLTDTHFDVVPLGELMDQGDGARVRVSLRHDLDANVLPASEAAIALESRGMVGSFYPLHTARYWMEVHDGVFCRQPGLVDVIGAIVDHGQEVGLHIDPLHVYFAHDVDGRSAILSELAWLRSVVGTVTGVVAHNSAPVYGAENFECLNGLALRDRRSVTWRSKTAPLQTIGWAENGLLYEGNHAAQPDPEDEGGLSGYLDYMPPDAFRRADWQSVYLLHNPVFSRRNDISVWLVGRDQWTITEHRPVKRIFANLNTALTFEWLRRIQGGRRVVIVIHPEYIGEL